MIRKNFIKCLKGLRRIDEKILDLLYPPRCPICDKVTLPEDRICPECRKKIHIVSEPVCMRCGKPLSNQRKEYCFDCESRSYNFTQGKALWVYGKLEKASIYRFKYQNKREYAKIYASELTQRYGTWIRNRKIQAIIPIPLHKSRKKKRGYNQAEILAKEMGKVLGIPVYANLLVRVRDTKPQKTLDEAERKNNLKRAFKMSENIVQLKYILLVDDIYTTGSTLDAAAAVLKAAGALQVYTCCISIGKDY